MKKVTKSIDSMAKTRIIEPMSISPFSPISKVRLLGLFSGSAGIILISVVIILSASHGVSAVKSKPPVYWKPEALNVIIPRSGQTNINVSLSSLEPIGNVTLEIVPELRSYISVNPSSVTNIHAGDTIPITITVKAASNAALSLFEGNIKVREQVVRKGKGKVFPLPLPVHLIIRELEETIVGSDTNTNGVWDYIDQHIETTFPGTENLKVRAAARQFARAIEGGLINAENKSLSIQYATASDRATECMYSVRPQDARQVLAGLEAAILNTALRSRAFTMFSDQSAGQVFRATPFSQRSTSCLEE